MEDAARLRPDGTYWDHGVSIDYLKRQWFAGVRRDAAHAVVLGVPDPLVAEPVGEPG